jgi:hypothetical protein
VRPILRPRARHSPDPGDVIGRGSLVLYGLTLADATAVNRELRSRGTFVRAGDWHRAMVTRHPRRDGRLHLRIMVGADLPHAVDAYPGSAAGTWRPMPPAVRQ